MRGSHRIVFLLALVAALAARCAMGGAESPTAKPTDTEQLRRRVEAVYAKLHALNEERLKATRDTWDAMDVKARAVFLAKWSTQQQNTAPLVARAKQFSEQQAAEYVANAKASMSVAQWRSHTDSQALLSPDESAPFEGRTAHLISEIAALGEAAAPILVEELDVRGRLATADWWRVLRREAERRWAAQALGRMGSTAVPHLLAFLDRELSVTQGGHPDLPAYLAISALAQTVDERALPLLRRALHQPDASVRRRAVGALGELKHASAVPLLIGALEDADRGVRKYACAALGDFAGADALPALRRLAAREPKTEFTKAGRRPSAALRAIEQIEARLKKP